ncbi:hypothetical protein B0H13DRAFT_2348732 [Mycena leptocephala]|nr:hypothetical protein B0H13DRAFT_2348732 [Mycena leptocephala]
MSSHYPSTPANSLNHRINLLSARSVLLRTRRGFLCQFIQRVYAVARTEYILYSRPLSTPPRIYLPASSSPSVHRVLDLIGLSINPSPRALLVYVRTTSRAESPPDRDT